MLQIINSRKAVFFALVLVTVLSLSIQGYAERADDAVRDETRVRKWAEQYDLFEPSEYAYHFEDKDVQHWAESGLNESDLKKQLKARQTVRKIAKKLKFKVMTTDGRMTAGTLSYWAERLLSVDHPKQIEHEFKQLRLIQEIEMRKLEEKSKRSEIIRDEKQIERLARKFKLFEPNDYAWTFEEGDIVWYSLQGMSEKELEEEFRAKSVVRNLAKSTGFRVAGPSGDITSGDLSYWAEFLYKGSMSEEQMEEHFTFNALRGNR